jgi:hypothetical protein
MICLLKVGVTAWDRYARMEYARLAIEEEYREEMEIDEMNEYSANRFEGRESGILGGEGGWEMGRNDDDNSDSDE